MEEVIFSVNTFQEGKEVSLTLTAIDNDFSNGFGTVIYDVNSGEGESEQLTFSFDEIKEGILLERGKGASLEKGLFISHQTGCFVLCGVSLAGAIFDCYRKNKKDWQGFKNCLKDKGVDLGTKALTCVGACFLP